MNTRPHAHDNDPTMVTPHDGVIPRMRAHPQALSLNGNVLAYVSMDMGVAAPHTSWHTKCSQRTRSWQVAAAAAAGNGLSVLAAAAGAAT